MAILTSGEKLTPESIMTKLSQLYEQTHLNHFNTMSYAEHKALGDLYESLIDFKDKIGELLLGYMAPRRFGAFQLAPTNPKISCEMLLENGVMFSKQLKKYSEENKYLDLGNVADELEGTFVKTKYLLTLT